jgi:hypothetical protein
MSFGSGQYGQGRWSGPLERGWDLLSGISFNSLKVSFKLVLGHTLFMGKEKRLGLCLGPVQAASPSALDIHLAPWDDFAECCQTICVQS